jgi:uncharacterized repeat protein (TIGR01451 family)
MKHLIVKMSVSSMAITLTVILTVAALTTTPALAVEPCFDTMKDSPAGPVVPGDTITYKFTVKNNCNFDFESGAQCIDLLLGGEIFNADLLIGETKTFSKSYLVTGEDCGELLNSVECVGTDASGMKSVFSNVATSSITVDCPRGGGEGCTPGYWKQPHHFDSWISYTPDTQFSGVFEDAFPGMTLLEVLKQGGGGLKAMGRHTVAALLNADSGVSYDFTTQQIIEMFNDVHPGTKTEYNQIKDTLSEFNEQGCPLN